MKKLKSKGIRLGTLIEIALLIAILLVMLLPGGVVITPIGIPSLDSGVVLASPGIAVDAVSTDAADSASFSISHECSGSNRLLVVSVCGDAGDKQVSSITFAAQPLTEAISRRYGGNNQPYVSIWYLKAPATGTGNTVDITMTAADKFAIAVISFTGVDQTTPVDGAVYAEAKGAAALSVDVTSAVGDLVLDASAYVGDGAPTVDPSQTQRWSVEMGGPGASNHYGAGSTEPGAATVTMSWTAASSGKNRVICAININAWVAPDISNTPDNYAFGVVSEGAGYKTGLTYFTVTNNSGYDVNITISGSDMTGGVTWTLSEDASQGANIYGLRAGREGEVEGDDYLTIVPKSSANTLVSGLASLGTQRWGLQFLTPTSFSDGASKSGIVTLTATQP